jgi:hypothetical protein
MCFEADKVHNYYKSLEVSFFSLGATNIVSNIASTNNNWVILFAFFSKKDALDVISNGMSADLIKPLLYSLIGSHSKAVLCWFMHF